MSEPRHPCPHPITDVFNPKRCSDLLAGYLATVPRYRGRGRLSNMCDDLDDLLGHRITEQTMSNYLNRWTKPSFEVIAAVGWLTVFAPGLEAIEKSSAPMEAKKNAYGYLKAAYGTYLVDMVFAAFGYLDGDE